MPRNQEVIRQWKVLHALESSRHGVTIAALADELDVTTRTIRRDLAALQEAGFPLFDERDDDGRVAGGWTARCSRGSRPASRSPSCARSTEPEPARSGRRHAVPARPYAGVRASREDAVATDAAVPGRLPACYGQARAGRPRSMPSDVVAKLLEATLHPAWPPCAITRCRAARADYVSIHTGWTSRTAGCIFLRLFRPTRTFGRSPSTESTGVLEKQTFTPKEAVGDEVFGNSLGSTPGRQPCRNRVRIPRRTLRPRPRVAPSQQMREGADGTLVLTMNVCHDWALRSSILGWGPFVRVLSPRMLATEVRGDLRAAMDRYPVGE